MLSRFFGFRGTIGRWAFIQGSLVCIVLPVIGLVVAGVAHFNDSSTPFELFLAPWLLLPGWCLLSLAVRRLRDMGWPALYGLFVIAFLTVVGGGLMRPIIPLLMFWPGVLNAVIFLAMTFPGVAVLALWPPRAAAVGLDAEIEALRLRAEAEGRIAPASPAQAGFGREGR